MTDLPQIRVLPVGNDYRYQLVDARTLQTLRPLQEHEASAMMSEGLAVIRVHQPEASR